MIIILPVIPSVPFIITIPVTFEGFWYEGEVSVGSKDAMFEPSFALQYVTERHSICMTDIEYLNIYLSPNCYVHVLYYFKTWICTLLAHKVFASLKVKEDVVSIY